MDFYTAFYDMDEDRVCLDGRRKEHFRDLASKEKQPKQRPAAVNSFTSAGHISFV